MARAASFIHASRSRPRRALSWEHSRSASASVSATRHRMCRFKLSLTNWLCAPLFASAMPCEIASAFDPASGLEDRKLCKTFFETRSRGSNSDQMVGNSFQSTCNRCADLVVDRPQNGVDGNLPPRIYSIGI